MLIAGSGMPAAWRRRIDDRGSVRAPPFDRGARNKIVTGRNEVFHREEERQPAPGRLGQRDIPNISSTVVWQDQCPPAL